MTRHFTIVILVLLAIYGFVEAWPLVRGPTLSVASPADGAAFPNGIVTVSGNVARAAIFTLDGAPLLRDQQGNFSSVLTFPRGGSILTFVATDRFGRTITATRTIFVPAATSSISN